MTKEELDADRKEADEGEEALRPSRAASGRVRRPRTLRLYREKPTTLRLKVPDGPTIVVDDLIAAAASAGATCIGDPVILRADGTAAVQLRHGRGRRRP